MAARPAPTASNGRERRRIIMVARILPRSSSIRRPRSEAVAFRWEMSAPNPQRNRPSHARSRPVNAFKDRVHSISFLLVLLGLCNLPAVARQSETPQVTSRAAAAFLEQPTFAPSPAEGAALHSLGYNDWIQQHLH